MAKAAEIVLASTQFDEDFKAFFEGIVEQSQFTPEQQNALGEALKTSIEQRDKIGNVLAWMEGQAEILKAKEKHLADRRKHFERFVEHAKSSLHQQMTDWGIQKVEGHEWIFSIKKNPPRVEITDESKIPADFIKYVPSIDRAGIKDALTEGKEVEGATLVQGTRLEIK